MKTTDISHISLLALMLFFPFLCTYAQNWTITSDKLGTSINTLLTDSITYEFVNGTYLRMLWRNGNIYNQAPVKCGNEYKFKSEKLEYEELSYESDGVDAIITKDSVYAVLTKLPDRDDFIFTTGMIGDPKSSERMLIDEQGFIKTVDFGDNQIAHVFYTSDYLILMDSIGNHIVDIPFKSLYLSQPESLQIHSKGFRATYTRNRIFRALSSLNLIKNFVKAPVKTGVLYLLRLINEGTAHRYGGLASDLIDLIFDYSDVFTWLSMADRLDEISYFGNAHLIALDAIEKNPASFILPIQINGLNQNHDFKNALLKTYENLVSYKYTLSVETKQLSSLTPDSDSQSKEIPGKNGIENFTFTFNELFSEYSYEPNLKVELVVAVSVDKETYDQAASLSPNAPEWTPATYYLKRNCTIYGQPNKLQTGAVRSTILDVQEITDTSAVVLCSFSKVPDEAECNVHITKRGEDISIVYHGESDKESQKIKVTGLIPNTEYEASSGIVFDRPYPGEKSINFATKGPSGNVFKVDNITDNSAIARCRFSDISNNYECGVVVTDKNGHRLQFNAIPQNGEQSIPMTGLKSSTDYYCSPFIKSQHYYHEDGNPIKFTTDPSFEETYIRSWYDVPGRYNYQWGLLLSDDGKASLVENAGWDVYHYNNGTWSKGKGAITVSIYHKDLRKTLTFTGSVDDLKNPTKLTGTVIPSFWGSSSFTLYPY